MNRLHTVQLIIEKVENQTLPWTLQQTDQIWMFLKDLRGLKRLKTLRLNLHDYFITEDPNFFYHLLGILGQSKHIETLDLVLRLINYEDDEYNESAK